jgi:hypothetical protein
MSKIFAVALLLVSFASIALADGSGPPPTKPPKTVFALMIDGSGPPPTKPPVA